MEKKLEEFCDEIEKVVIKYNEEIHAGILLNHALALVIEMITNTSSTKEKGFDLIEDMIKKQKNALVVDEVERHQ